MRVKMLVSMAGPTMREPGQVIEVSEEEAVRLIAAGFAVQADDQFEAAAIEPPEKVVLPAAKRKKVR